MKISEEDRRNHASPNSAQTEAAMAGALDVQLAGNAYYFGKLYEKPTIGDPIRPVEIEDIPRANKLLYATCIVGAIFILRAECSSENCVIADFAEKTATNKKIKVCFKIVMHI